MSSAAIEIKAESRAALRTIIKVELRNDFRGEKFTGGKMVMLRSDMRSSTVVYYKTSLKKVYRFNVA